MKLAANHFWIIVIVVIVGVFAIRHVSFKPNNEITITDPKNQIVLKDRVPYEPNNEITIMNPKNKIVSENWDLYALYSNLPPLTFKIGEEKILNPANLHLISKNVENNQPYPDITIKLVNVDKDGRSYTGTMSGVAVISAQIVAGKQNLAVQFHLWDMVLAGKPSAVNKLNGENNTGNMVTVGPYQIYLASLNPYRQAAEKIDPSKYVGTFFVDTLKNYNDKQKAIDLATAELEKRRPNDPGRFASSISPVPGSPDGYYRITFVIPLGPTDSTIWVDVDIESGKIIRFEQGQA